MSQTSFKFISSLFFFFLQNSQREFVPPGSSHFTAAVIAKRNETRKAFLSAAPSPLTNYDLEAKQLTADVGNNSLFPLLDPVIFTPGDPRISSAIAAMNFDPHETFKPRPDSELEFLDPLELEIEHFKRYVYFEKIFAEKLSVDMTLLSLGHGFFYWHLFKRCCRLMWESKEDRTHLPESPKIEAENDASAVFHFEPLV